MGVLCCKMGVLGNKDSEEVDTKVKELNEKWKQDSVKSNPSSLYHLEQPSIDDISIKSEKPTSIQDSEKQGKDNFIMSFGQNGLMPGSIKSLPKLDDSTSSRKALNVAKVASTKNVEKVASTNFDNEVLGNHLVELSDIHSTVDDKNFETRSVFEQKPTFESLFTEETRKTEASNTNLENILETPLNFKNFTAEDLGKKEFLDLLLPQMDIMEKKFEEFNSASYEKWSTKYNLTQNHELKLWLNCSDTTDHLKVHLIRQKAVQDVTPEEFCEVIHDIEYQKANNSNIKTWERLAEYKTKDMNIEIGRIVTHKIIIINPRETIYVKFCKIDREKGTLINIKKSIVLKEYPVVDNLVRTNMHISAYKYTSQVDPDNNGKIKTEVDGYSSTDCRTHVGITILKPTIKNNCKAYIKVNMEESHRRVLTDSFKRNQFDQTNSQDNEKDV